MVWYGNLNNTVFFIDTAAQNTRAAVPVRWRNGRGKYHVVVYIAYYCSFFVFCTYLYPVYIYRVFSVNKGFQYRRWRRPETHSGRWRRRRAWGPADPGHVTSQPSMTSRYSLPSSWSDTMTSLSPACNNDIPRAYTQPRLIPKRQLIITDTIRYSSKRHWAAECILRHSTLNA